MSSLEKLCGSILFSLMFAAGASAGEPADGAAKASPAGATGGETARFDPAKAGPAVAKVRDGVGSLPSVVGSVEGAVYTAKGGAEPSASKADRRTGTKGVSVP